MSGAAEVKTETVDTYNKLIEANPKDENAWMGKGKALYALERYEDALDAFDKVIEINSSSDAAWVYKGRILVDLEEEDNAIRE